VASIASGPTSPPKVEGSIAIEPGPDVIAECPIDALIGQPFRISPASDRTGTRLEGSPVLDPTSATRASLPMIEGAIERTPSALVILGPDHPTTGGCPVVAVVRTDSLDALFARPRGAEVRLSLA